MAAMKPRTGDGPLEVTKEGRGYVMRVPLEGGGRLVVELNGEEAKDLGEKLLVLFAEPLGTVHVGPVLADGAELMLGERATCQRKAASSSPEPTVSNAGCQ